MTFRLTQIPRPKWARDPNICLNDMKPADYAAIQERRDQMIAVLHSEIEAYMNTPGLYYDGDEQGFPHRQRMTGEYYIGDESYAAHVGPVWFQIGIMARCLEKQWQEAQKDFDYLGLEVWLRCEPGSWIFSVFRNTDSSSI